MADKDKGKDIAAPAADTAQSLEERRAALEARKAQRREELAKAEALQRLEDEEAIEELRCEHESIAIIDVTRYRRGLPTMAAFRCPNDAEYRRYKQQVQRAKDNATKRGDAQDLLAQSCWVYPAKPEDQKAMGTGILTNGFLQCTELAEGKAREEGKD